MTTIIRNIKGVETLVFAKTFEFEAYDQIKKLTNFEAYTDSKIRVMPDAHAGKGCTVGTTMTISDKVTPNLVGVDIGCGMLTVKLKNKNIGLDKLDLAITENVPSGQNAYDEPRSKFDFSGLRCHKHVDLARAACSLGTLGGGNHFIEAGILDSTGELHLIIHSGSRKLGVDICKHYQDKAFQSANEMSKVIKTTVDRLKAQGRQHDIESELKKLKKPSADKELAFLEGNDLADYMNDMAIAQAFAMANRAAIAKIIMKTCGLAQSESFDTIHNYIDFRRMILRKGAVSAELGEKLLIPINMRDGSLLCSGKGNPDWNFSAPHGAGRLMSRSKAKQSITMEEFTKSMTGIHTTSVSTDTIDEAPQAYKHMTEIIEAITPTAEIIGIIKPIYNFKAHQ